MTMRVRRYAGSVNPRASMDQAGDALGVHQCDPAGLQLDRCGARGGPGCGANDLGC